MLASLAVLGGYDTTQFITYYSGKVLANLSSPEGGGCAAVSCYSHRLRA